MVEFVKGDTHGSKAVPPRFKDHTKLVCARHSRSGRKKYVKKHPERVRKVPSRKVRISSTLHSMTCLRIPPSLMGRGVWHPSATRLIMTLMKFEFVVSTHASVRGIALPQRSHRHC
jgi:hypothetical protein